MIHTSIAKWLGVYNFVLRMKAAILNAYWRIQILF